VFVAHWLLVTEYRCVWWPAGVFPEMRQGLVLLSVEARSSGYIDPHDVKAWLVEFDGEDMCSVLCAVTVAPIAGERIYAVHLPHTLELSATVSASTVLCVGCAGDLSGYWIARSISTVASTTIPTCITTVFQKRIRQVLPASARNLSYGQYRIRYVQSTRLNRNLSASVSASQ